MTKQKLKVTQYNPQDSLWAASSSFLRDDEWELCAGGTLRLVMKQIAKAISYEVDHQSGTKLTEPPKQSAKRHDQYRAQIIDSCIKTGKFDGQHFHIRHASKAESNFHLPL